MQQPSAPLLPVEVTDAIEQMRAEQGYGDVRLAFERGEIVLVEKRSTHKVKKVDAVPAR